MKSPHVLLVGKFSLDPAVYTYPSSFIPALQECSERVTLFNTDTADAPFIEKISSRFTPLHTLITHQLFNKRLLNAVHAARPDIIFIIKGVRIGATMLRTIKRRYPHCRIIHFYPDNPFCLWNGNSNAAVLAGLPFIDLFLIWSKQLIPIIRSAGCQRVNYFPFAYDETIYHPIQAPATYSYDAIFVGTWDTQREQLLTALVTSLPWLKLAIWGNRWHTHLPATSPLHRFLQGSAIYKEELITAFAASKIVLNFIRPQNLEAHNMRTFEALATGCFLLTQKTAEQSQIPFIEDSNIACFSDADDLIKKIAFYVNQDSLRKAIALRGLELAEKFTLRAQIRLLMTELGY
jgi:hypothetical protein